MSDSVIASAETLRQSMGHNRYRLTVDGCTHLLDVLKFSAEESLSAPWHYNVTVTSDSDDIACDALLLKPASFSFQVAVIAAAPGVALRTVFGVVQSFRRIASSADETRYVLTLVPRIALLQHTRRSEIYLNQSVTEVVEQVLRSQGLEGADYEFRLVREYPRRELITQWRESDLQFVQRLLAEVGIFWRFEMDNRLEKAVVIFQDSQQHYQFGVKLPLRPSSGLSNSGQDSIDHLQTRHHVVSDSVSTRDYNYREALTPQDSLQSINSIDGITTGEVYHYAEPFLAQGDVDSPESGAFYARLRHEGILSNQCLVSGETTSPLLVPGQVLESEDQLPQALGQGIVITGVRSRGSRSSNFRLCFSGIPYSETLCWRPARLSRPVIAGTLPARVESTQRGDTYAWLDSQGRYRVRLDYDRVEREQGYRFLWLRMAKPYAGDAYGWHAPLLDGTEVSIAFDGGDPDRPYIAYAQHDSAHPDHVTSDNHSRNVLRTPANNKLRMEDQRQQEHIKLATEYGKSQLNMGHLVNAQREPRGSGFELRTDEYGALRAGKGLFLTAEEQLKAQGDVLEMSAAVEQINQANNQMQTLNSAAQAAQALTSDIAAQLGLVANRLQSLQSAVLLASAPQGIALTSGGHLQFTSGGNTLLNAGRHVDVGAMKNVSVAAGKAIGLFAHSGGAKLIANQGDVVVQAQHNRMELCAGKQFTITSTDDEIVISTPETLTLNGGGSYLKLSRSGIEHGTEGDYIVNSLHYLVPMISASLTSEMPVFNETSLERLTAETGANLSR